MFCTDMMPRSTNAALEQGERTLNGVCVRVSHNIDSLAVVNRFELAGIHASTLDSGRVGRVIVGEDHVHVFADVLADILRHCPGLHVLSVE